MATDDRNDPRFSTDAAFERWILESAKLDAPSEGATARSWAQLTQSLGAASPDESPRLAVEETSTASGMALKWLALGALGGALVTATWMSGQGREAPPSLADQPAVMVAPAEVGSAPATTPPAPAPSASELESAASGSATGAAARAPGGAAGTENAAAPARKSRSRAEPRATAATAHRHSERRPRARRAGGDAAPRVESAVSAAPHDRPPSRALSTLEREVALLDAVRSALTVSDYAGALRLIAQYRREFERGELARDADVFEVEAFAGQGERARAARAARMFLRLYPRDPHATRLRALAELPPD